MAHVAQMIPRLDLTRGEREQAVELFISYLDDNSAIVKSCTMQALVDLATADEQLRQRILPLLQRLTHTGTAAMKARGRKLLEQLLLMS